MDKIPTLFKRGPDWNYVPRLIEGTEWVLYSTTPMIVTEKLDGINVMVYFHTDGSIDILKRKTPSKEEKEKGYQPYSIPIEESKLGETTKGYIRDAVFNFIEDNGKPYSGPIYGECIGPKFQGNRYELDERIWIPFRQEYLPKERGITRELGEMGVYHPAKAVRNSKIKELYDYFDETIGELKSNINPEVDAEGVVIHSYFGKVKVKREFPERRADEDVCEVE